MGVAEEPRTRLRDTVAIALAVAIAALIAIGLATAPAQIRVVAEPADAHITVEGLASGVGEVDARDAAGRSRRVVVSRPGYRTRALAVEATRLSAPTRVVLSPADVALSVHAGPPDALVSVYRGERRVLVGRRRVSGELRVGRYRIVAEAPGFRPAERTVVLDRPTRVILALDPRAQQTRTLGVVQATGRVRSLAFSRDGSLLAATLVDGPPAREVFALATLRRVPGSGAREMGAGFSAGTVGRQVRDPRGEGFYSVDATSGVVSSAGQDGLRQVRTLARLKAKPQRIAVAGRGRILVVGCAPQWDRWAKPLPALYILTNGGKVLESIDSPAATAIAVARDGRTVAVADTLDGRIRIMRVPAP